MEFMRAGPPRFNGDPSVDPYKLLVGFHKRLHKLGLVGSNGVDFTSFKFFGPGR